MTYVITDVCEKDQSCVAVCPVDCIHPTPGEPDWDGTEQVYIDPETCIDCAACVSACPVDAIYADTDLPEANGKYIEINAQYYARVR
jgi:ferredoxin--NADP+ reductase